MSIAVLGLDLAKHAFHSSRLPSAELAVIGAGISADQKQGLEAGGHAREGSAVLRLVRPALASFHSNTGGV